MVTEAIGVDVGGTKVLAGLVEPSGARAGLVSSARVPTPATARGLVDAIVDVVATLDAPRSLPVGIGCAGLVDRDGVVRSSPNLADLHDLRLAEETGDRLGRVVTVANDATCAVLAEHRLGAGAGIDDLVLVTLGTGIGCGFIVDGRVRVGARGFAGEAGHMVIDPAGPPCVCGKRGCWERYASGSGLARIAAEAMDVGQLGDVAVSTAGGGGVHVAPEELDEAARAGSVGAEAVYRLFSDRLALGLANLVNVLDPELVILGGGLVKAADLFMEPTRKALGEYLYDYRSRPVRLELAELGEEATVVGAALLAAGTPGADPTF